MSFPYRLNAVSEYFVGDIQIQLIEPGESPRVYWQCELPDSKYGQLALLEPLDKQRFVAATNLGHIYIGNYADKQIDRFIKLSCISGTGYWLDKTQATLWMAASFRNDRLRRQHLAAIDLNTGELTAHWPLEAGDVDVEEGTLSRCYNGRFAFYARNSKPGYKFRKHGIYSIDPNDGKQLYTQLPSKPTPVSISPRRWLFQDKRRGLALMPACDQLTKVGEDSFAFDLQLLDLNSAEVRWTRTVRQISPLQIRDLQVDELTEALNRIAAGKYIHTDNDEWQTLLTSLTGVWFDPDRDEIWLGWQDWHLQKIGLDGEPLSPLYQLGTEKGDGTLNAPTPDSLERLVPVGREGNTLLLDGDYELDQHLTAELPEPAGQATPLDQQEVIWLRGQPLTRPCIEIPTALQAQPSPGGCVLVTSSDLNTAAGVTQALKQLLILMPELEKSFAAPQKPSGWLGKLLNKKQQGTAEARSTLFLLFCDALGEVKREEFFYDAVLKSEHCRELIAEIVKCFNQWPSASHIAGYEDLPPLACAVCCLAGHKAYLPLLADYFCAVGGGEDVAPFHINQTLRVIREEHENTPELDAFMQAVPWPYHDKNFSKAAKDPYDDWDDDDEDDA